MYFTLLITPNHSSREVPIETQLRSFLISGLSKAVEEIKNPPTRTEFVRVMASLPSGLLTTFPGRHATWQLGLAFRHGFAGVQQTGSSRAVGSVDLVLIEAQCSERMTSCVFVFSLHGSLADFESSARHFSAVPASLLLYAAEGNTVNSLVQPC